MHLINLVIPSCPAAFGDRAIPPAPAAPGAAAAPASTLQQLIDAEGLLVSDVDVELDYSHVSTGEILRRLLPAEIPDVPTAFEAVGHIAHLNLRDEVLPYRHIVGAVLLDKNPRIRTVINKLGTIENEWRVFDMEILAGEADTVAEVMAFTP